MNSAAIDLEIQRRAAHQVARSHLVVDYYRIRRKVVYELPLTERPDVSAPLADQNEYPWEIWLLWEIEERIGALGWAAELCNDSTARLIAERELAGLANWATFVPPQWHGLTVGHYLRLLCTARDSWSWISADLRAAIDRCLQNAVAAAADWFLKTFGPLVHPDTDPASLAKGKDAFQLVHNIKVIALLGFATAANTIGSSQANYLNGCMRVILRLLFLLRDNGLSEAVAYDGYLLDFIAFWMQTLPPDERDALLRDPHWPGFLDESLYLSAPGSVVTVAELSDVEPVQMPFHVTAQARLQRWIPEPRRVWYLQHCPVERLRVDGLICIRQLADDLPASTPPSGALDALYARVLRSGYESDDVAVAVATSTSQHGHIHNDYGSICIGTQGHFILTDPGYQQYNESSERVFTMGARAHNAPLVNAQPMTQKAGRVLKTEAGSGIWHLSLDLTACYSHVAAADRVLRDIWLIGKKAVVVADRVAGARVQSLDYHWHGHPDAAWSAMTIAASNEPAALVYLHPTLMWITSPSVLAITPHHIHRQSGSRGHLTLSVNLQRVPNAAWWIFSLADKPHAYTMADDQQSLSLLGHKCSFSKASLTS